LVLLEEQYLHFCFYLCGTSSVCKLLTSLNNMQWKWSSISK